MNISFWIILYIIDAMLFIPVALTTIYMLVFAAASLIRHRNIIPKAKHQNRFVILIPAYRADKTIIQTVLSVLGQSYPQRLFDVTVISDHEDEMTNFRLAQLPITLAVPNFEISTKAKSLQFAMKNLPEFKIYDAVLILDADNVVAPEFLEAVNDAYETAGTKAIQLHRVSKNRDTAAARLDAIFEEINNSVFRLGHISLGISSATMGSGIVFDFNWFHDNVTMLKTAAEDKEIEALLMQQHIFVDYFNDIYVYDEKTRTTKDFNRQRSRFISTQFTTAIKNMRFFIPAMFSKRYDYADKILQWMLIPRTVLIAIIVMMSLILPFIYMTLAIKWWITFAVIIFAFALATPDYLIDKNFDKSFLKAPFLIVLGLINLLPFSGWKNKFVNKNTKNNYRR
jgi:cellulose synthase/poly-beta-1,6-N-acetylglucosamine synthase-like glycosyltransferase